MRDAVNIDNMLFNYRGTLCKVSDFWMTENGEIYTSLNVGNGIWVNIRASELHLFKNKH